MVRRRHDLKLVGYTKRCVISFVDTYAKNRTAMKALGVREPFSADGHENGILGQAIHVGKDKNQRAECGCVESIEVGTYHTCLRP